MDNAQRETLKRFAHDEAVFNAVQDALREFFLKPSGTDVHTLAAEKILLNRLPHAFNAIKQLVAEKSSPEERQQIGL